MMAVLDPLRKSAKALHQTGRFPHLIAVLRWLWQRKKNASDFVHMPGLVRGLKAATANKDAVALVDVIFDHYGGVLRPLQDRRELARLMAKIAELKPQTVVEVGTAKGGTLFLFSRISSETATLISVDLPGGLYGGGYPRWKTQLYKWFAKPGQTLRLIRGNSHDQATVADVEKTLGSRKADVLFIDGDHSYQGVKLDFFNYRSLVRPRGLIIFHDILDNKFDQDIKVAPFWRELKKLYATEEIVESYDQGVFGIGVMTVPDTWN
jgi:predicted O-methyltransferase YrrM